MPTYVYQCEANGASVEVVHRMSEGISNWGELCDRAECDLGDTPPDAPVQRQIFPTAIHSVQGPAALKNLGFQKLVRRDSGVYEDVTATDTASRIIDSNVGD